MCIMPNARGAVEGKKMCMVATHLDGVLAGGDGR
jgi:hypothetical protein